MEFRVIIPASYTSSKQPPGEPLRKIGTKPIIQHTYERAVESGAESVVVATDDERILKVAEEFGAPVCLTSADHNSGTERLAEAVVALGYGKDDIVVNMRAGEPLIPSTVVYQVACELAEHDNIKVATLCRPIDSLQELFNPEVVKVVMNKRGHALYFSRAPIAWEKGNFSQDPPVIEGEHYRHIGIYAYRVGFLAEYMQLDKCDLEKSEKLEQLRVLWYCNRIYVALAKGEVPLGVDITKDLKQIERLLVYKTSDA